MTLTLDDLAGILIDQAQDGGIEQADKTWLGNMVADILTEFKASDEVVWGSVRPTPFGNGVVTYAISPHFDPFKGTYIRLSYFETKQEWKHRNIYTGGVIGE